MNNSRSCRLARALSIACLFILIIPQTNFAQTEKGIELYNLWKFQEAQNVLREAFDADQKDIKAGYFLGLSLLFAEKHAEALDVLLKVEAGLGKTPAAARPAVPMPCQVQVGLARARLGLEQYEEAWKNLEAARKMDPDFPDLYIYRGVYYMRQNDNRRAIRELEEAIKLDSENPYAYYYAGHAHLRYGNGELAVDMFERFLELAPLAPEAPKAKVLIDALC